MLFLTLFYSKLPRTTGYIEVESNPTMQTEYGGVDEPLGKQQDYVLNK